MNMRRLDLPELLDFIDVYAVDLLHYLDLWLKLMEMGVDWWHCIRLDSDDWLEVAAYLFYYFEI